MGRKFKHLGENKVNKLKLLKLAKKQDSEAYMQEDIQEEEEKKKDYKDKYQEFYNDIKQKSKYIKEDW